MTFSLQGGKWMTCGCGGKKKEEAVIPVNSKPVFIRVARKLIGPVTGIEYNIQPHMISLDIDTADADVWLKENLASPQVQGNKGRLTRTGVVHAAKQT